MTALSLGTQIDIDDGVAVTPSGHLLFSLCRETYQTLGIEGKPSSAFGNKRPERYCKYIIVYNNIITIIVTVSDNYCSNYNNIVAYIVITSIFTFVESKHIENIQVCI